MQSVLLIFTTQRCLPFADMYQDRTPPVQESRSDVSDGSSRAVRPFSWRPSPAAPKVLFELMMLPVSGMS